MYTIKKYSYDKAKKLGVMIRPSVDPVKKIDVFTKSGRYITSIGARGYGDYPTYLMTRGVAYARIRRKLYKIRHEKNRHVKGSAGYYADQILW